KEKEGVKPKVKFEPKLTEAIFSKSTLRSNNHELSKEESRRQYQAELARKVNEETARRLSGGYSETVYGRSSSRTSNDFTANENPDGVPQPRERMIMVDEKNEAILIRIYGLMVPFHVATVKPVTTQADTTRKPYIPIIFNPHGTHFSSHDPYFVHDYVASSLE
ncbi:FACT complex subunit SPT16-like protein, partial [Tanacetum coccineum]